MYSHSLPVDVDCLPGCLCMTWLQVWRTVPAAASVWHDFVDRMSSNSEIWAFKIVLLL